jgi:hypothetical protein
VTCKVVKVRRDAAEDPARWRDGLAVAVTDAFVPSPEPVASFDRLPLTVDQLTTGPGDPVLVVDFIEFSAAQRLSEVLSRQATGNPVYRLDPVTDLTRDSAYWPLDKLADGYADLWLAHGPGRPRLAVVGYCSAAALAWCIAARLASLVQLGFVLVRPTWPDAQLISAEFADFRADLGGETTAVPDLEADPELALRQMQRVLRDDLHVMAAGSGLDPASPSLTELLDRYRAWLGFLLSSSEAQRRPWPGALHPHVLVGADTEPLVLHADSVAYEIVRCPVPGHALMDDANLADSVLTCAWQS